MKISKSGDSANKKKKARRSSLSKTRGEKAPARSEASPKTGSRSATKARTKSKVTRNKTGVPAKSSKTTRRRKLVDVSAEARHRMIAEAAFVRAEQRQFRDGDPVDDWLAAEREVEKLLGEV